MSVEIFCRNLPSLPFGKNDRKWFPMWIRRYAGSLKRGKTDALSVDEPEVIRFLKALRDNGTPAWQRLQAARAVEAYRQHIVKKDQPSLVAIKQMLQRLAARHGMLEGGESGPAVIPGKPDESPLIAAVKYESTEMPPDRKLAPQQIEALATWVEMGPHGRKPRRLPACRLLRGSHILARRMYIDLIGVLPSPEQVQALVAAADEIVRVPWWRSSTICCSRRCG